MDPKEHEHMKTHLYKSHKTDEKAIHSRRLQFKTYCGQTLYFHLVREANIKYFLDLEYFCPLLTSNTNKVTCLSCSRTTKFTLRVLSEL